MPCDYSKYPPDWTERRNRILQRAKNRCEFCGAENYQPHPVTGSKVVLTIAHLDHDPENWDVSDDRLKALCQKCHLAYDREHRMVQIAEKQLELFKEWCKEGNCE